MTCTEAREAMAGLLAGRLGLTEWAELEAHTAACETCDQALDYRYRDLFEERMGADRPVASRAGRTARRVGISMAAVLALGAIGVYASPRLLPEISETLRGLRLPELAGDFLASLTASLSRVASTLAPSAQDPRIASGPPVASTPAPPTRPAEDTRSASPPPAESVPMPPPARPAEDARTVSPPPAESMPTPPPARRAGDAPAVSTPPMASIPTPATTAPPTVPSPPAVTPRPPTSASSLPPRPAAPRRPPRASEPKPEQKATAQKPAKERSVAQSTRAQDESPRTATSKPLTDARADVIAQLSVQDRQEARRDIGLLLARLGGSRKAERESTVWLVVPRSRYSEFTRGLAQIGASQMEQGSNALPDPVAVTVVLTR